MEIRKGSKERISIREKEKVGMEIRKVSKERISIPREGEGRNGNT